MMNEMCTELGEMYGGHWPIQEVDRSAIPPDEPGKITIKLLPINNGEMFFITTGDMSSIEATEETVPITLHGSPESMTTRDMLRYLIDLHGEDSQHQGYQVSPYASRFLSFNRQSRNQITGCPAQQGPATDAPAADQLGDIAGAPAGDIPSSQSADQRLTPPCPPEVELFQEQSLEK